MDQAALEFYFQKEPMSDLVVVANSGVGKMPFIFSNISSKILNSFFVKFLGANLKTIGGEAPKSVPVPRGLINGGKKIYKELVKISSYVNCSGFN